MIVFFFKQKTAYELRISDWSSDVCSSDLGDALGFDETAAALLGRGLGTLADDHAGQHVGDCAQMSDLLLGTMADRQIEDEDPRHLAARHDGKRVVPVRPRALQTDL